MGRWAAALIWSDAEVKSALRTALTVTILFPSEERTVH